MPDLRPATCCFSGYRVEKMPFRADDARAVDALCAALGRAVEQAVAAGYTRFLSGMSTGFDLWAAEAVLRVREQLPVQLLCAIPFDRQAERYPPAWKQRFNSCLLAADRVYALSRQYHVGCYAARNRFMVEASSRLICYFDGRPGGTAQTVRMAEQAGLTIVNLAARQLRLF
ncbi:MAG: SLOG family protein [Eubacteriales bacterium]|nr:SLOG family protein [Eubacteriales bacterium]